MKQLVELPMESGGSVLVEAEIQPGGMQKSSAAGNILAATNTLENALETINPAVSAVWKKIQEGTASPQEITVQFGLGLRLNTEGALKFFISGESNASLNVSLSWRKA